MKIKGYAVITAVVIICAWCALSYAGEGSKPQQDAGWLSKVQKELAAREYHASDNGKGIQAPNRAQNIRTYFSGEGISITDRTKEGGPELLRMSLRQMGREGRTERISAGAKIKTEGSRVEIEREGIREWYRNTPEGLEQGFTITERPEGEGEVVLSLDLDRATAVQRGEKIVLETEEGRKLEYTKLKVTDAEGRELKASMRVRDNGMIEIALADVGASYPVMIDPIITATADALLEPDQAGAYMGWSVSGAGDVNGDGYADVIVGAPYYDNGETNEGAAFVYHGGASGISTTYASMFESNQANAYIGWSVSGAGDVNGDGYADVIVGARYYDNGETDEGAAFVYHGGPSGISTAYASMLESNQANAGMGNSVSGAGDVNGDGYADVIVGAPWYYNHGNVYEGAAFVYHGGPLGINTTYASLLEPDQVYAYMGWSVSGAGDVNGDGYADVIVGARYYDNGETNEGAAFVYHGGPSGISTSYSALLEPDQPGALMGYSVSGAGDVNGDGYADVIVGAYGYDNGQTNEGAAFVYHGGPSGINTTYASLLEPDQVYAYMGWSVSGAGDVNGDGYADVIVGARYYDNGETDEGAAFVYHGGPSGINTAYASMLESDQANAWMGFSVSGAGDVNGDGYADVIAGAYVYDNGQTDEGAVFVCHGSASGINTTYASLLELDQPGALMGHSVSGAGDVNGDGYADVIVGARYYDNGETDEGAAFVYHGSASGIGTAYASMLESNQDNSGMGASVSGAGDVNGDGYADVIVGAYGYDNGQTNEGAAFVYHGGPSGINTTYASMLESNQANAWMGWSVSGAGDVNGDGYADVIVGASGYNTAFVYHGGPSGINTTYASMLESDQADASMGWSVSGAGDVNGDGYADVIVGAFHYDNGQTSEGAAFVYHGGPPGINTTYASMLEPDQADAGMGFSVSGAGDVNGDGYADVIVGAYAYDNLQTNEGAAFVYHGGASGINPAYVSMVEPDQTYVYMGYSVSGAGDVNGDGYADVIVGAWAYDNGQANEGAAFVYHGGPLGINTTYASLLEPDQPGAGMGESVSGAGDVNGDGYADVIVGVSGYNTAFVYHGNSDGRQALAGQMRGDASAPVQAWGSSRSRDSFTVIMDAYSSEGRGRGKLEIEYCPAGVPFEDASCGVVESADWTDTGLTGVALTKTVSGLAFNTLYKWRARVKTAPLTGTIPDNPSHGPWRRLDAQAGEADIRTANLARIGVYQDGTWYLDADGSMAWEPGTDVQFTFGKAGDIPVTGDWNGDGYTEVGVVRGGIRWYLDVDGDMVWDPGADSTFKFGIPGDIPVTGDWNGDGYSEVGVLRGNRWYLDVDGDRAWDPGADSTFKFGIPGDIPVTGDWNGDGYSEVGVQRGNRWYLDVDGDRAWDPGADSTFKFGIPGDIPVTGDWNGDGYSEVGVLRGNRWYLDMDGDRAWDPGADSTFKFGILGDIPVTGKW